MTTKKVTSEEARQLLLAEQAHITKYIRFLLCGYMCLLLVFNGAMIIMLVTNTPPPEPIDFLWGALIGVAFVIALLYLISRQSYTELCLSLWRLKDEIDALKIHQKEVN